MSIAPPPVSAVLMACATCASAMPPISSGLIDSPQNVIAAGTFIMVGTNPQHLVEVVRTPPQVSGDVVNEAAQMSHGFGIAQQLVVDFEEAGVDEVVVLDARERERREDKPGLKSCAHCPRTSRG